ncbi:ABC transporter substrate-binding protein [Microbacterium sp.]|uniref:ABC transporter substrate-binding protein n=1 Tax=Microbacterium sp. TaxID=51671 RepID=UPI0039E572C0
MTLRSRSLAALAAAALAVSLTACASGSDASSDAAADDNPYGLIQPGVLRAGTLTDAPPNVYIEDGKFTGFDNDLLVAVAAKLDLEVEFVGTEFSSLLAQVKTGKFDVGSSSVSITEERKKNVAFTNKYDFGFLGLDVPAGSDITSFDQLEGKRVAVVQGTVQDDYATKAGLDPVRVPDYNAAINQLNTGTADAWITPDVIGKKMAEESGGKVVAVASQLDANGMGFVVSQDNTALLDALNEALDEVIADGTWEKLQKQYYPDREIPEGFVPGSGAAQQ